SSTGSPASRRFAKFTPLTTLPSSTSRHGMTRTATSLCCCMSVVLRCAGGGKDVENLGVYPRGGRQRRARLRRPGRTVQVGDDAAGGAHQGDSGGVVPDVVAETDRAAE